MEVMIVNMSLIYTNLEFLLKIILASSLGAVIGFERKNRNKEAGIRTHSIVCLASALMMIVSKYGFEDVVKTDGSRIASQVVTGIGFLGAGLIFVKNNAISGLTTAAGVWATAGIGLAVGSGLYGLAIFGAALIVVIQILMHKDTFLSKERFTITFEIPKESSFSSIQEIRNSLERLKLDITNVDIVKKRNTVVVKFYALVPIDFERNHLEDVLLLDDRVKKIEL